MLTAIKGYYDNGHIVLMEQPPVSTKTDVIITFLQAEPEQPVTGKRVLGLLEGKIKIADNFDDPMEEFIDYM